jgi:methyl-accepting chemotaxis protein
MLRFFADLGFRWKITLPMVFLAVLLVLMGGAGLAR